MGIETRPYRGSDWSTEHPDLFAFATERSAPRRGSWIGQLRRDLRSPLMWAAWLAVPGSVAAGVALKNSRLFFFSGFLLSFLLIAFFSVSRRFATSSMVQGVVGKSGRLRLEREVLVPLPRLARERLAKEGKLEVLALHDSKSPVATLLGWRAP